MVPAEMVRPFVLSILIIGVSLPVIFARPPKDMKNSHQERRHFDEETPEATLNCTTSGNGKKSSTNSNVYVEAFDKFYPETSENRYMDLNVFIDGLKQTSLPDHNRSNRHPKSPKKMVLRMIPVPVMVEEYEDEETNPFEYPHDGHRYPEKHEKEDISEETSAEEVGEVISSEIVKECDENRSKPCTEDHNNSRDTSMNEENSEEDLEASSEEETSVKQKVGILSKDPSKSSQLSQNVKISNRLSRNNDTNSSHDCIKHHIIQIININSKDLIDENYDEWYEMEDEIRSLSDDILVSNNMTKPGVTTKDIILLLKKILTSSDTTPVSQGRRNESISYKEAEESYNKSKEDLTIKTDESEVLTTTDDDDDGEEEEIYEESDVPEINKAERNKTTTVEDHKESESIDLQEKEIQAGVSDEKSFAKRSSVEKTGTLEEKDPYKIKTFNPKKEEDSSKTEEVTERTRVQKIPKKRKYSVSSNAEDQDSSLLINRHSNRSKREAPKNTYNITQSVVSTKKSKKSLSNKPAKTNIYQHVVIFEDGGTNKKRVIKIGEEYDGEKDIGAGKRPTEKKVYDSQQDNSIHREENDNAPPGVEIDDRNEEKHREVNENGVEPEPTDTIFDGSFQDNTIKTEENDTPSSEDQVKHVQRDVEGEATKEMDGQSTSSEIFAQNVVEEDSKSTKDDYNPSSEIFVENVEIHEEDTSAMEKDNGNLETTGSENPCKEKTGCKDNKENIGHHQPPRKPADEEKCKKIFQILNLVPNKFQKGDFPKVINQIAQINPHSELMRSIKETYPFVMFEDNSSK